MSVGTRALHLCASAATAGVILACMESPSMADTPSPPIRLTVDRHDGLVDVTLVGQEISKDRYHYVLEVTGASRSRLAANYVGTRERQIVNRTRFPDKAPWTLSFRITDAEDRLVYSRDIRDH